MTTQITELAIISLAFGTALGYLIGIIQHLAEMNKSEGKITLPLV